MKHDWIYFYKSKNESIPIMTGSTTEFNQILFLSKEQKKVISNLMPIENNLYVLVDNHVFRLLKS